MSYFVSIQRANFLTQDTASLGVDFERNHCKYPARNTCIDPENYKKPEAWKCV